MGKLEWDEAWNIGHQEIDTQHRRWIELFNELESAFLTSKVADLTEIQHNTLKKILHYTRYHFACEESAMQQAAYPDIASHWRYHKEFDKTVYQKFRDFENGELLLSSELLGLIKSWLLQHIQVEDQKFGAFLRGEKTRSD